MAASTSPLNQPMTPRSCALGCLIWLAVMAVPALIFYLALQGELDWRRGPGNLEEDRLFVINEPGASGLGYLASRLADDAASDAVCVRTTVTYLLWRNDEGGEQNVSYCACYARNAAGDYEPNGQACLP
jgi:hypothetical protein